MEIRPRNPRPVMSLAIHEAEGLLAIGQHGDESGSPNLTLWDIETGRLLETIETTREEYVTAVAFSGTGTLFYYTREKGLVRKELGSEAPAATGWDVRDVRRLEVHPDGSSVLSCGESMGLWDVTNDRPEWTLPDYRAGGTTEGDFLAETCWDASGGVSAGYENYPALGAFSEDGDQILIAGDNRDRLLEIDTSSRQRLRSIRCSPLQVSSIAHCDKWSVAGVVGRIPTGVFVWDMKSGNPILETVFNRSYTNTSTIAFSRSKRIALVGTTLGFVNLHTLDGGNLMASVRLHRGTIRSTLIIGDGEVVATAGDDGRVVISKLNTLL